jgi:hypothetical protein
VAFFTQRRPFGLGYARGFLTPRHIEVAGQAPADFWLDLQARCAAATPEQTLGTHRWAVLHFQRGAQTVAPARLGTQAVAEIGYTGPAAAA